MLIKFLYPELFLLAIPLGIYYWRFGRAAGVTGVLRVLCGLLLLTAMTGPRLNVGGEGLDVVLVVDRSRSLPDGAERRMLELIQNLERNRTRGDRIGIVTFGGNVDNESLLSESFQVSGFTKQIQPDGSDLNGAIHVALDQVANGDRPARVLIFSDGESNGASPLSAARRARELGVPLDFREFPRVRAGDVAIENLQLPEQVAPREPFQYAVDVYADREVEATVHVLRDGQPIAKATRVLTVGANRFLFRDILDVGGTTNYEARLDVADDVLQENNRGAGVVKVQAGPKVLVLNQDGQDDNFVRALRAGHLNVEVASSKTYPLTRDNLDRFRAVVLENVPAGDFGRLKLDRLAQFVEDLGGGLLVTGGQRSFGTGGYFKSPLDEVLPVSMEMREEHRKTRVAIAIALDRSGSMMAPVSGGKVKMDLANLGTAECIKMLSAGDSVAVIAVDSSPHIVQGLTPVEDVDAITQKVLGIQSMGGGIFVYEALVAAGNQLMNAEQATKHIILFSDANDSEEPGAYKSLLAKYETAGITTSVIGLGTKTDVDAKLLEEIAKLGKGNIMFTEDAKELPRLFTEDTMSIARSSFVEADPATQPGGIPGHLTSDIRFIGEVATSGFPAAGGYNLSYLKPQATLGTVSDDEYQAPWTAYWYRGLGRVAAITLEVDGKHSGNFAKWDDYADFCITHVRWLMSNDSPDDLFVKLNRDGQDAVVTIEYDERRPPKKNADAPTLKLMPPGDERQKPIEVPFQWRGPNTLEARFRLAEAGTYRSVINGSGKKLADVPAMTLPYSPEFMPRHGLPTGQETLRAVAELTAGKERLELLDIFGDAPRSPRMRSIIPWLLIAAVCVLLLEIAGRRLSLWGSVGPWLAYLLQRVGLRSRTASMDSAPAGNAADQPASGTASSPSSTVPPTAPGKRPYWPVRTGKQRPSKEPDSAPPERIQVPSSPVPVRPVAPPTGRPESAPAADRSVDDIYSRAKRQARKRND